MQKKDVIPGETLFVREYFPGDFDDQTKLLKNKGKALTLDDLDNYSVCDNLRFLTSHGMKHLLPWFLEAIETCTATATTSRIAEMAAMLLTVPVLDEELGIDADVQQEIVEWRADVASVLTNREREEVFETLVRLSEFIEANTYDFPYEFVYIQTAIDWELTIAIWSNPLERGGVHEE